MCNCACFHQCQEITFLFVLRKVTLIKVHFIESLFQFLAVHSFHINLLSVDTLHFNQILSSNSFRNLVTNKMRKVNIVVKYYHTFSRWESNTNQIYTMRVLDPWSAYARPLAQTPFDICAQSDIPSLSLTTPSHSLSTSQSLSTMSSTPSRKKLKETLLRWIRSPCNISEPYDNPFWKNEQRNRKK